MRSHQSKFPWSSVSLLIDRPASAPTEAGKKALQSLKKNNTILSQEATRVNSNEAYRATIRNHEIKYADHVMEIMWIKMPSSNVLLKVAGISNFKNPDKGILACFNTFRVLVDSDLKDIPVANIVLRETNEWGDIKNIFGNHSDKTKQLEGLLLLNGLKPNQNIPKGNYLKVVQQSAIARK